MNKLFQSALQARCSGLADVLTQKIKHPWCPKISLVNQDHTSKIVPSCQRFDNICAGAESQPLFPRADPYCISRKHLPNVLLLHQRQRLQPFPGISSFGGTVLPVELQGVTWMRSQCSWGMVSSLAQYCSPWSMTNLLHFYLKINLLLRSSPRSSCLSPQCALIPLLSQGVDLHPPLLSISSERSSG